MRTLLLVLIGVFGWLTAAHAQTLPTTPGWFSVPNTHLATVGACSTGAFPQSCGNSNQYGLLSWSGGFYDYSRHRLLVWGGGHTDYNGNEFYFYDLAGNPITVQRLNNPSNEGSGCAEANPDGTASSRHSYDALQYSLFDDTMFVYGGSLNCTAGSELNGTWLYKFSTASGRRKLLAAQIRRSRPIRNLRR